MKRTLFALLLLVGTAHADTIGIHLGSKHSRDGFNDTNPGLYVRTEAVTAGAYCNSESESPLFPDAPKCKVSAYVGRTWSKEWHGIDFALTAGAIIGYSRAEILPLLVPSVAYKGVRLHFVPPAEPKGVAVLHVSYEF